MNWFRQNRWLGSFLILFGLATLLSLFFLWRARSAFAQGQNHFNAEPLEEGQLKGLVRFRADPIYRKIKFYFTVSPPPANKIKANKIARGRRRGLTNSGPGRDGENGAGPGCAQSIRAQCCRSYVCRHAASCAQSAEPSRQLQPAVLYHSDALREKREG